MCPFVPGLHHLHSYVICQVHVCHGMYWNSISSSSGEIVLCVCTAQVAYPFADALDVLVIGNNAAVNVSVQVSPGTPALNLLG